MEKKEAPAKAPAPPDPWVYNMLMQYIPMGLTDHIKTMITEDPRFVNLRAWHGQTSMHQASLAGHLDVVQLLVSAGGDPNAKNDFDETPVHYACKRGLPPVLLCLLQAGGDIWLVDKAGKSCLHKAAEVGSVPVLHMLKALYPSLRLDCRDGSGQTPLHLAIKDHKLNVFHYLTKHARESLSMADSEGNWPIHLSVQMGYGDMVFAHLCIMGLQVLHVPNKSGRTVYQLAKMYHTEGHWALLRELAWQREGRAVDRHAQLLWWGYLLTPLLSFAVAALLARFLGALQVLAFLGPLILNLRLLSLNMHRLPHISRLPHPFQAGLFGAGMLHTILVYLCVLCRETMAETPAVNVSLWLLTPLLLYVYFQMLTVDPGVVRTSALNEVTGQPLTALEVYSGPKWETVCTDCQIVRPPLTRHCNLCQRCLRGMDHHCLFLMRCVAADNHRFFLWLLLLTLACVALFLLSALGHFWRRYEGLTLFAILATAVTEECWLLVFVVLNGFTLILVLSFLSFQLYLVSHGMTFFYRSKRPADDEISSFHKVVNVFRFLMNFPVRDCQGSHLGAV